MLLSQLNQAQGSTGPGKLANDAAMHEGGFNGFTSAAEVNYICLCHLS